MHRSYSLRSARAPTASQQQAPPPPPSSTKSRFFSNPLSHTWRKTTAANSHGPELSRKLALLVKLEKNVMRSYELVGRERKEVAKQISIWGEETDDDVSDVTDKLGVLIFEIGELEDQFIDHYDQYRLTMKSIRNIEASVQPSRDRKAKLLDQIAHLKHKDPESEKIIVMEQELVRAEAESLVAEAQLSNITREKVKTAFGYQFDALREHAEKLAIIANYGKHLLDLIDDQPVTPGETRAAYDGYEASRQIIIDCENSLAQWTSQTASVRPSLSVRRRQMMQEGGVQLEDQPLQRESSLWVPAEQHANGPATLNEPAQLGERVHEERQVEEATA
ncbi:lipid-binding protein [Saitoella coloradoensis]